MKTGKTLIELATEIERQRTTRQDFIARTGDGAAMTESGPAAVNLAVSGQRDNLAVNDLAHRQIGTHCNIPAAYYDRMKVDAPGLLVRNVNHWFEAEPEPRMVRVLDGRVRAFLSDRYRPLENADLAEAVLPLFMADSGLAIVSCEITERRLYIKAVDNRVVREVRGQRIVDGRAVEFDHVSPSLTISNSEVGAGALSIEAGMFTHACKNMAIFREKSLRKYHVGARHGLGDDVVAMLSARTQAITDAATWAQVQDVVKSALSADVFTKRVEDVQAMTGDRITGDPVKAIDLAAKALDLRDLEKPSILRHLIEGGDLSRYGLFNAVTRAAEDVGDYDRATDFERAGGKVIELPQSEWRQIAEAA